LFFLAPRRAEPAPVPEGVFLFELPARPGAPTQKKKFKKSRPGFFCWAGPGKPSVTGWFFFWGREKGGLMAVPVGKNPPGEKNRNPQNFRPKKNRGGPPQPPAAKKCTNQKTPGPGGGQGSLPTIGVAPGAKRGAPPLRGAWGTGFRRGKLKIFPRGGGGLGFDFFFFWGGFGSGEGGPGLGRSEGEGGN